MGFSAKQLQALRRSPDHRRIRTREANGRQLSYLEGWYAISEANRIFGFDGWSRETLETRCALTRENRGAFVAIYVARVRITVRADGAIVIREGHGTGEGHGTSPGEVHDIALKAAETDATKRALATFGKPFGLELYRGAKTPVVESPSIAQPALPDAQTRTGFHPDDTTPIPRPSTYYGRRHDPAADNMMKTEIAKPISPPIAPTGTEAPAGRIDKSQLTIAEPKRLRDKAHLKFVASQPCLICGRQPSDPHHVRYAQPRAIGMKVSDEFTVPLCRGHHGELHRAGNEVVWWQKLATDPLAAAKILWQRTHPNIAGNVVGNGDATSEHAPPATR